MQFHRMKDGSFHSFLFWKGPLRKGEAYRILLLKLVEESREFVKASKLLWTQSLNVRCSRCSAKARCLEYREEEQHISLHIFKDTQSKDFLTHYDVDSARGGTGLPSDCHFWDKLKNLDWTPTIRLLISPPKTLDYLRLTTMIASSVYDNV